MDEPWGRGGGAAQIAPLMLAIDAKARTLLGRRDEIKSSMEVWYVPWLDTIQNPGETGSLAWAINETTAKLTNELAAMQQGLSPRLLQALAPMFEQIAKLPPNAMPVTLEAGCGYYSTHVGDHKHCAEWNVVDGDAGRPRRFCAREDWVPDFQRNAAFAQHIEFENKLDNSPNNRSNALPPVLELRHSWAAASNNDSCTLFSQDTLSAPVFGSWVHKSSDDQIKAVLNSDIAHQWDKEIDDYAKTKIAAINDYRHSLFAMVALMSGVREARKLVKHALA
jgi:hypothetical protein